MQSAAFAILVPISIGAFGVFAKFSFDTKRDRNYAEAWFWAALATLPGFLSALYLTGDPAMPIEWRNIILGSLGGAVGISTAIWLGYVIHRQPAVAHNPVSTTANAHPQGPKVEITGEPLMSQSSSGGSSIVNQGPGSAYSVGQQGGITAGTVNVAPPRLAFSSQLGRELLAKMPTRKKVALQTVGNDADQALGTQIQIFLSENGYPIERTMIGVLAPPPNGQISLSEAPGHYLLIVAPSAS